MRFYNFHHISERFAVSCLFFVNGFITGSWAVHIPDFAHRLSIGEAMVGILVTIFGIGAIISMPLAGASIAIFGDRRVTSLMSGLAATTLIWIALTPTLFIAFFSLFLFGALIAAMDVAMNATAVNVECRLSRPIMSSCHGFWSLGGLVSAFLGGVVIQFFGPFYQLLIVTIIALAICLIAIPALGTGKENTTQQRTKPVLPRTWLPYMFGIIALFSVMPEGAVIDWSVLYMRKELLADPVWASAAFGLFSGAMALVRFIGDFVRLKYGAVKTARTCAIIGMFGFVLAGVATQPIIAIIGFFLVGLGLSNLVPIVFSAAGNQPGIPPGVGISIATTIGYSGMLVFPAFFGFLAEYTGFSMIFISLSLLLFVVFCLAGKTKYADQ